MTNHDRRGIKAAFRDTFPSEPSFRNSTTQPFAILPMAWFLGGMGQSPAHLQHVLYQIASQQAAKVLQENYNRRRAVFANAVYQWN